MESMNAPTGFTTIARESSSTSSFTKAFVGTKDANNKEDIGTLYAKTKPVRKYTGDTEDLNLGVLDMDLQFGVIFASSDTFVIEFSPAVSLATAGGSADSAPLRCVWTNGSTKYIAS